MSCYAENLKLLEQFDKDMYVNYLSWLDEEYKKQVVLREEVAKSGTTYLIMEKNGKQFRMNSCYSPENEAREWAQQFSLNNIRQVVIMYGLGNGAFLAQLRQSCKEDAVFVIYEPSLDLFHHLMQHSDLQRIIGNGRMHLLVQGLNEYRFGNILEASLSWDNINHVVATEHPKYKEIYPQEYVCFCQQVNNEWVKANMNRNTMGYFGQQMVRNTCENLAYLSNGHFYEQYIGRFGDAPVIIVSAGPSLDLNIEKLKSAKGKAVIIAVDSAMRELDKHGVEPDFIVSIDPKKSLRHMEPLIARRTPLFCSDTARSELLEQHEGEKIFFGLSPFAEKLKPQQYPEGKHLGTGGSVSTSTFSLSVALQFKTVIFVGQDLAYKNGMSHAGNRMVDKEEQKLFQVEDIFGNMIASRHDWYQFLGWYEENIKKLEGQVEIIDATEGGARIPGTKIMSLEKAIETYGKAEIDCKKIVEEINSAYTTEHYERMLTDIENVMKDMENSERDIKEVMFALEQLCRCCERKDYGKTYKKLTKDVVRLGANIKERDSYILMASWIAKESHDILGSINQMDGNIEDNEMRIYKKSLDFYKELEVAAKEVKQLLRGSYKKIIDKE